MMTGKMNQEHVMHLQVEQLFTYRVQQVMAERLQNTGLMVYGLHTVQAAQAVAYIVAQAIQLRYLDLRIVYVPQHTQALT
jgi:hypothetical protein